MKIDVTNLSKAFDGKQVLNDFSAVFEDGSVTLLTGRSGIGKTTLLRIIMGLCSADTGTVTPSSGSMNFGAVFQEDRLLEQFTAEQNLSVINPAPDAARILEDLKALIPDADLTAPVSSFSGGMKRRVAVIRACLSKSDVLIMDEPFTGMDDKTREETLGYIMDRRDGRTLIIASHITDGMEGYCRVEVPEIER